MASRYYCVQFCHFKVGWTDLPGLCSKKEKECNDWAKCFAENHQVATRTIRKPHDWEPEGEIEENEKFT